MVQFLFLNMPFMQGTAQVFHDTGKFPKYAKRLELNETISMRL